MRILAGMLQFFLLETLSVHSSIYAHLGSLGLDILGIDLLCLGTEVHVLLVDRIVYAIIRARVTVGDI